MDARNSGREKMDVSFLLTPAALETVSKAPFQAVCELQAAPSGAVARPRPDSDAAHIYDHSIHHTRAGSDEGREQYCGVWEHPAIVRRRVFPNNETPPFSDHDRTTSDYTYYTGNAGQTTAAVDFRYPDSFSSPRPVSPGSISDTTSHSDPAMDNKPRPPRPAYNEEQRFFIMFSRIVLFQSWPEIEHGFGDLFGRDAVPRSRGGLTSVYYRVRKRWGLEEVLKTDNEATYSDRFEVGRRAQWMSPAFLDRIGYRIS